MLCNVLCIKYTPIPITVSDKNNISKYISKVNFSKEKIPQSLPK